MATQCTLKNSWHRNYIVGVNFKNIFCMLIYSCYSIISYRKDFLVYPNRRQEHIKEGGPELFAVVLVGSFPPTPPPVTVTRETLPPLFVFLLSVQQVQARLYPDTGGTGLQPYHTTAQKPGILTFFCSMLIAFAF